MNNNGRDIVEPAVICGSYNLVPLFENHAQVFQLSDHLYRAPGNLLPLQEGVFHRCIKRCVAQTDIIRHSGKQKLQSQ